MSFFDSVKDGVLTWLPLVFFGFLVYLVWRTLALMPRVKPTVVEPSSKSSVSWEDVAGVDEVRGELQEVVDFLQDPASLRHARRASTEGHSPLRPAGHREDAARQGRRPRVRRELLLAERLGVRRDVRRSRRLSHPQALRHGTQEPAGDRVHRRARRRRDAALGSRIQPRARSDAEPAPRRAGRLRGCGPSRRHRRLEPARGSRPGSPAPGPIRPPDPRLAARPRRARGHPRRTHPQQAARPGRRPLADRPADLGPDGSRSRECLQRGRDRGRPPRSPTRSSRRTSRPLSSASSRGCSSAGSSPRRRSASSPTTKAATR